MTTEIINQPTFFYNHAIGVGTTFTASAIYRLLSVHYERIVCNGEEAINRGRRKRGPYLNWRVDKTFAEMYWAQGRPYGDEEATSVIN